MHETFGQLLRRLRRQAELSQPVLAQRAFISQSTLSRLETGRQPPDFPIAARLDEVLDTGGLLTSVLGPAATVVAPQEAERLAHAAHHPRAVDQQAVHALAGILADSRRLEDSAGTALVTDLARGHLALTSHLAREAVGCIRHDVIDVASQWAQFAGWLAIAADQHNVAARWLDRGLELATEANDRDMIATVLSFKGHSAWLTGHVGASIGLSQAAQRQPGIYAGQLAYDALQEARGHAARGDADLVDRKVDEANLLSLAAVEQLPDAPPWHYYRDRGFWLLEEGRVYRYLGRATKAAELLTEGLGMLPPDQQTAEWAEDYRIDLRAVEPLAG